MSIQCGEQEAEEAGGGGGGAGGGRQGQADAPDFAAMTEEEYMDWKLKNSVKVRSGRGVDGAAHAAPLHLRVDEGVCE